MSGHFRRACIASLDASRRVGLDQRHWGPATVAGLYIEHANGDAMDARARVLGILTTLDRIITEETASGTRDELNQKEEIKAP